MTQSEIVRHSGVETFLYEKPSAHRLFAACWDGSHYV